MYISLVRDTQTLYKDNTKGNKTICCLRKCFVYTYKGWKKV